jgi:serine protease inhibitor
MKTSKAAFNKISAVLFVGVLAFVALVQDSPALANANNSFGFDLLGQIAAGQPGKNIFISPFSAACALQMVANGAAGQTKSEMESVLKTAGWADRDLKDSYRDLSRSLTAPRGATLEIANSIWYQDGIRLKPGFIADNKSYFKAGLAPVDFESPKSADIINGWARKNTRGKIDGVVSFPFPPLTTLVLADAIYFKGKWVTPFKKEATQPREFHLPDGRFEKTPMMQRDDKFNYQEKAEFQAVQLPYNGHLRMEVFLPKTNSSPQKLVEAFRGKDAWQKSVENGFREREGFLVLPKFKIAYEVELNAPLEALGMKQAFVQGVANFSAMANEPLFVGEVKQKSFVSSRIIVGRD